ncbi:hypothetical protein DSM104299_01820 [Baekduia alba]|uniref:BON domain-containing protein n=1 Tax=Baekduia alba TaxID=2997333 RepID=UPI0023423DCB|nr:BON domain-containing protein [Baekduia alba]WCB93118.1 hypothetical protein DSM104299_01820 [Baekduia alba]
MTATDLIPAPPLTPPRPHASPARRTRHVGSFRQRRAAVGDAREIDGVYNVDDQLEVRLLDDLRRDDADIRGIVLQILMWDVEVPADLIDVKVTDGWVTLKGDVSYQFESDAAFEDVAGLLGVVGVTNQIRVTTP